MFNIFGKNQSPADQTEKKTGTVKTTPAVSASEKKIRRIEGVVVSDKMKKTVVVSVERLKFNNKYRTYYKATTRFKAHDENNEYHPGDKVIIEETRPISKDKCWRVIKKV